MPNINEMSNVNETAEIEQLREAIGETMLRTQEVSWAGAKLTGAVKKAICIIAVGGDVAETSLKDFHDKAFKLGAAAALLTVIAIIKAKQDGPSIDLTPAGKETVS